MQSTLHRLALPLVLLLVGCGPSSSTLLEAAQPTFKVNPQLAAIRLSKPLSSTDTPCFDRRGAYEPSFRVNVIYEPSAEGKESFGEDLQLDHACLLAQGFLVEQKVKKRQFQCTKADYDRVIAPFYVPNPTWGPSLKLGEATDAWRKHVEAVQVAAPMVEESILVPTPKLEAYYRRTTPGQREYEVAHQQLARIIAQESVGKGLVRVKFAAEVQQTDLAACVVPGFSFEEPQEFEFTMQKKAGTWERI